MSDGETIAWAVLLGQDLRGLEVLVAEFRLGAHEAALRD